MIRRGLTRDILISLAVLADFAYAHTYKNQMRRLMFDGWYRKSSFGPTVAKILSVGDIEKVEKNGQPFYRLTSRGWNKLRENIPIFKLAQKRWDGRWRIVIFDIKEKTRLLREGLRRKLLSLGFGRWQRSVYISPHPIEEEMNQYLQSHKLFPYAICLVVHKTGLGDDRALADFVWKLDELNDKYEEFIDDCGRLKVTVKTGNLDESKIGELWINYRELISKDPCLPAELLPNGWLAERARKEIIGLYFALQNIPSLSRG